MPTAAQHELIGAAPSPVEPPIPTEPVEAPAPTPPEVETKAPTPPPQPQPQPQPPQPPHPPQQQLPPPPQHQPPPPQMQQMPPPQMQQAPPHHVQHAPPSLGQQRFVVGAITTRLTVTVPGSIVGGDLVRVAAPDGSYHSVVVPSGLSAGQQFSVELLAGHADGTAAEVAKLRVELDAERHLRRDLQQEANRFRSVRHRTLARTPHPNPKPSVTSTCTCACACACTCTCLQHTMTRLGPTQPPPASPHAPAPRYLTSQAFEALQQKRHADHAYFRDSIKRQKRLLDSS